jgi:hypothetical protein
MINMSTLTIKHKIDLFNKLYKEIAGHGINGDTELAHVNKHEAVVLKAMGGSGTVNAVTGLREYWGGDDPAPAPAPASTTTVKQVSDLPEYFKPYVEELFATAQDVYEKPYVPYGHQLVKGEDGSYTTEAIEDFDTSRLAPLTKEQQAAFGGLRDMFTTLDEETGQRTFKDPTAEGFTEAERLATRGARGFDELGQVDPETGEVIKTAGEVFQETYMSPYKQAVTDIQVKEEQKIQEQQRQKRQGAARLANALGHGRYGMQEALSGQLDRESLDKIRKKGLQEAWTSGLDIFQKDRAAASSGAMDRARLTGDELSTGLKSLGALQTTGEVQRALDQQKKDLSYEEFVRQQQFPKQNLQELSGILRGFQVQPTTYQTSQQYKPPMSLGQQLMAAGTLGAGISKGLGKSMLGSKGGGSINAAGGGLMGVVKQYADGGMTEERKREFRKRLRNPALGVILGGKPVVTVDEEGETVDAVVPGLLDVLKQVQSGEITYGETPKRRLKAVPVEEVVTEEVVIPEGADDELTQEEFLEQVTRTESPTDSSSSESGWNIEKIMAGFGEGFDEAAPYLASYAKQKGWTDTAEGLKGISEAALKKAQKDYYAGLGTKAKAWEVIEKAKAGVKLRNDEKKIALNLIKTQLNALKIIAGGDITNVGELPPEIQNRIMQLARNAAALGTDLQTIDASRVSFEPPLPE